MHFDFHGDITGLESPSMILSPSGHGYGLPFLASYCGNNSGTDMLEQYGDFGTN